MGKQVKLEFYYHISISLALRIGDNKTDNISSYTLGVPMEDEVLDGRFCKVTMREESPNQLVTFQESLELESPVNTVVTRYFYRDKMIMTLQCQEVISTAQFIRLSK